MMWQILTTHNKEEIFYMLVSGGLFSEERAECHKVARGTYDLLYIHQHTLLDSKNRRKNVAVT